VGNDVIGDDGAASGGASARHRPGCRTRRRHRQQRRGPVGAVVGGAVGAVTGTVGGILGIDDRPRFHEYVAHQHHTSYRYGDLRVGAVLPPDGVTYYDVPGEYHVRGYRYAYVNDHAVLVDPRTRQIVEIVD
jgi:hypothetical protein